MFKIINVVSRKVTIFLCPQPIENKTPVLEPGPKGENSGKLKNEGYSHDVVENKGRVFSQFGYSHDVDENKVLISFMPRYL